MRRFVPLVLLAVTVALATPRAAGANTIPIGAGQAFTTLADGYAAAVNGDTLLIFDGIYAGGLTVDKLLTFQAVNIGGAIVQGGGANGAVFTVAKDSTFIGLTVRNASSAYFQRDNNAHGVIEYSVIYGVNDGVEINDTGGTGGSFDVLQSTITNFTHAAIEINDGGTINVTNSIIANGPFAYVAADFNFIKPDHNLLFNIGTVSAAGSGGHVGVISLDPAQIVANPLFVDAANFDFRLAPGSPAIDSGVNIGFGFQGAAPDRGALETVPEPSSIVLLSLGLAGCAGYRRRLNRKSDVSDSI